MCNSDLVRMFRSAAWRSSILTTLQFTNVRMACFISYLDGTPSSGLHGGHTLRSSTAAEPGVRDLMFSNVLTQRSRRRPSSRRHITSSPSMYCEINVLFPSTLIPLRWFYSRSQFGHLLEHALGVG